MKTNGEGESLCWLLTIAFAEEVPVGTLIGSIPTKAGFTYRWQHHLIIAIIIIHLNIIIIKPTRYRLTSPPPQTEPALLPLRPLPKFRGAPNNISTRPGRTRWLRLCRPGRPLQLPHLSHRGKSSLSSWSNFKKGREAVVRADHVGERWCHGHDRAPSYSPASPPWPSLSASQSSIEKEAKHLMRNWPLCVSCWRLLLSCLQT